MPKGPKGQKRPASVTANAVLVMKIATGEKKELPRSGKSAAAAELGRKGGAARAKKLTKEDRKSVV